METQELLRQAIAKAGGRSPKGQIASIASVRQEQVSRWLAGKQQPSDRAYRALLRYIGTPLAEVRRLVDERVAGGGA